MIAKSLATLSIAMSATLGMTTVSPGFEPSIGHVDTQESLLERTDSQQKLWAALDVPQATQSQLEQKQKLGGVVDADNPNAVPVSTERQAKDGFNQTTQRFNDGSVAYSFVETPSATEERIPDAVKVAREIPAVSAGISPSKDSDDRTMSTNALGVGNCSGYSSGSGYSIARDCLVTGTTGSVSMTFRATYTLLTGSNNDQINSVNTKRAYVTGGTAGVPTLNITKSKESSSGPARAIEKVDFTRFAGGTSTHRLALNVGGNSAWASWVSG